MCDAIKAVHSLPGAVALWTKAQIHDTVTALWAASIWNEGPWQIVAGSKSWTLPAAPETLVPQQSLRKAQVEQANSQGNLQVRTLLQGAGMTIPGPPQLQTAANPGVAIALVPPAPPPPGPTPPSPRPVATLPLPPASRLHPVPILCGLRI
ncbi:uncharacterized protein BDR25DRAFT_314751 [Lindgomyces ingoldianus]|uniref:Uncharacterized protein n=1 Tax=Lindgomyces ingoldianus TaxID=673940 RepID=A0ACB6QSS4_9PLEO|nr:uncharacterized protein BDR25DRAFT_314751 [Lindgomyces ingoldianus]KAF2469981.1 hypothetical protein BDR25DRAFT_314751 [Lindgomyces ingoldianus]